MQRHCLPLLLGLFCCACTQLKPTALWVADQHGLDAGVDTLDLGNQRWQIRVETSTLLMTGNIQQRLQDAIQRHCSKQGRPVPVIEREESGLLNSLTGGRRYATAIVHCDPAAAAAP